MWFMLARAKRGAGGRNRRAKTTITQTENSRRQALHLHDYIGTCGTVGSPFVCTVDSSLAYGRCHVSPRLEHPRALCTRMSRGNRRALVLSAPRARTYEAAVTLSRPRFAVPASGQHVAPGSPLSAVRLSTPAWDAGADPDGCSCRLHLRPPELSRLLLAR